MGDNGDAVLRVTVEIARGAWPVRGYATFPSGSQQPFWGWGQLQLMVDALLEESDQSGASLTPAEVRVISLVYEGLSTPEIARLLVVSPRTVQGHLYRIFRKLGVHSRTELVREWVHRTYIRRGSEQTDGR